MFTVAATLVCCDVNDVSQKRSHRKRKTPKHGAETQAHRHTEGFAKITTVDGDNSFAVRKPLALESAKGLQNRSLNPPRRCPGELS